MKDNSNKYRIVCDKCGTSVYRYKYQIKDKNFCSKSCANSRPRGLKERIKLNCDWCGKKIYRLKCTLKHSNHFCSLVCKSKYIGKKLNSDQLYKDKMRDIALRNGNKPPLHKKENHWNWKGGISNHNRGQDYEYLKWRKNVLRKYNYICQICGQKGGKLSAHHKYPWYKYSGLRYNIDNGICLCYNCHMKLHGLKKNDNARRRKEVRKDNANNYASGEKSSISYMLFVLYMEKLLLQIGR